MTVYRVSKSFTCRTERSERVLAMAEAFGLGLEEREFALFNDLNIDIRPGDVVYITGQSGSGKSQLLKELSRQMTEEGLHISDINSVSVEGTGALIDRVGTDMQTALDLLSRAGINDAYLAIRKPEELSDGQLYRFRLAKLFEANADVWTCDEFGAVLDRITAKTVAFSAQKLARARGKTLIVATTHTDLVEELGPDLIIEKRFQERVNIIRPSKE